MDWADLATLDLSTFDQPGGKEKLAKQLSDAIQNVGKTSTALEVVSVNFRGFLCS